MRFADSVAWRHSKRGLVLGDGTGGSFLLEHAAADSLPELVARSDDVAALVASLGGTADDERLVADLIDARIVVLGADSGPIEEHATRVRFTRSGLEIAGIGEFARKVHTVVMPLLSSTIGRIALAGIVIAGIGSLLLGRPEAPEVSDRPWLDATLGLVIGLTAAAAHELAHAVALVHYGRTPRAAGCGFYWGALCFYVDSTDGLTLPRKARIIQAAAGLAVDLVTTAILAIVAQLSSSTLLVVVSWRLAILGIVAIVENSLPILEVDGQLILSDLLDEPDLSSRARAAFGDLLRGRRGTSALWLRVYGGFSLFGGIALLGLSTLVWWSVAGAMITALLTGSVVDIVIGLYIVVPFLFGVAFSVIGLIVETTSLHSRT